MVEKQQDIKEVKRKNATLKSVRDTINAGLWITGNLNFFLFVSVLTVLYIANGHMADKVIRNINKTQNDIKELQYQYKTVKSEVMYKSEEVQVLKATEPLGLKISKDVPKRINSNN